MGPLGSKSRFSLKYQKYLEMYFFGYLKLPDPKLNLLWKKFKLVTVSQCKHKNKQYICTYKRDVTTNEHYTFFMIAITEKRKQKRFCVISGIKFY